MFLFFKEHEKVCLLEEQWVRRASSRPIKKNVMSPFKKKCDRFWYYVDIRLKKTSNTQILSTHLVIMIVWGEDAIVEAENTGRVVFTSVKTMSKNTGNTRWNIHIRTIVIECLKVCSSRRKTVFCCLIQFSAHK